MARDETQPSAVVREPRWISEVNGGGLHLVLHEPLMDALAERSMVPDVSATFNTQNVANVAWAFARLGIRCAGPGGVSRMGRQRWCPLLEYFEALVV